jgi:hypothetical protein
MGDGWTSMTRSGLSLVIAALLLQAPAARAAQLDKDSCAKLKTELSQLEQGGTRASLGKGPEWAKTNLAPEKLEQVRRLIELDEQLLFRCGGRPLVIIPHDPDPAAGEVESKDGAAKAPPAKAAKKTPEAEKKQAVPLKKAAAPPADQPAKEVAKEAPPVKTAPQPETAPAPAKGGEDKKAAAPPIDQPAKEVAKETLPVKVQPEAAPVPAKEGEDKKAAAPPADQQPAKEAAKETSSVKMPPQPETGPAPAKEAEDKKAAAIKAAKAKAKKKANDAYSPPPFDWFNNPFASQGNPATKK